MTILTGSRDRFTGVKNYVWAIDQACSVKMAGFWPSSFWRVYAIITPKRTRPIFSHLDRTSLVNKGFIFGEIFLAGQGG